MKKFSRYYASALVAMMLVSGVSAAGTAAATTVTLADVEKQMQDKNADPQVVLDELQTLLKSDPKNARLHFLTGVMQDRLGYRDFAEQEFLQADKLDSNSPKNALKVFTMRVERDDLAGAQELLQYVHKRFPNDPCVQLMQGLLLVHDGQYKEAEKLYEKAIREHNDATGIYTALAIIRMKQGRYQEAINLADTDLKRNPNHTSALLAKGNALLHVARFSKAIAPLSKAFETTPYDRQEAARLLALAYMAEKRPEEALRPALWDLALSVKPNEMNHAKGIVATLFGKLTPAQQSRVIASVDQEMSNTVIRPRLHFALGDVYDKTHNIAAAESEYRKGLAFDPNFARGWYRLGKDKEQTGDHTNALVYFMKAHTLNPRDPEIQAAYLRLANRTANRNEDIAWRLKDWMKNSTKKP